MHRNRTWLLDPIELRTQRNRILPIEGGDGSTLTLDFTTGVLDPRLTFTRSTDATFINSNGQVQYADANWVRNSTMLVSTGWTVTSVNGGTATINGDGSVTFASTAGRITWLQTLGLASGLPITFSIEVTALTAGDIRVSDLFAAGFGFGSQIYHHTSPSGVTQNNISSTAGLGTFGVGLYTVTATTTGTTNNIIFGTDCNGVNRTGSVTIRNPQLQYGTVVPRRVYVPNSSTSSAKWDSARFDYDPTTLAPRGLLIEGQVATLNQWGEDYTNAYWTKVGSSVGATAVAGPDNVSTATRRIVESATTAQHGIRRGIATTAGQTHTVSVFVKPGSYNSFGFELFWSASYNAKAEVTSISGNTQTVTSASGVNATLTRTLLDASGWYRYALTFTHPLAVGAATPDFNVLVKQTAAYAGNGTNYMDVYGFMLEAGSGASSYIPTGASQGSRAADKMSMTDISTMQWNQTAGTFALHMDVAAETNTSSFPAFMGMYTATPVRVVRFLLNNSSGTNPRIGNDTWTATPTQIVANLVTRSAAPTAFKFAVSLSNTGQTVNQVVNAGSVTTASGTGTLQTPTRLLWHQDPSAGDTEYFPIHIRSLKYWPTALPTAQLQSITT